MPLKIRSFEVMRQLRSGEGEWRVAVVCGKLLLLLLAGALERTAHDALNGPSLMSAPRLPPCH